MIFQHTYKWIIDKSPHTGLPKTQTRRLVRPGDVAHRYETLDGYTTYSLFGHGKIFGVKRKSRWLYKVGADYAVQPSRGEKAVGRIEIIGIRQEQLRDITEEDAQAEGVPKELQHYGGDDDPWYIGGFINLWDSIHPAGYRWIDDREVWVLEFKLVGG